MKDMKSRFKAILAAGIVFAMLVALLGLFDVTMATNMQAQEDQSGESRVEVGAADGESAAVEAVWANEDEDEDEDEDKDEDEDEDENEKPEATVDGASDARVSSKSLMANQFEGGLDLSAVYMRSEVEGPPYGVRDNEARMDEVFDNWRERYYENANPASVFSSETNFVFMEGSDHNADEMQDFLNDNRTAIESWVEVGGCLLLNAALIERDGMDLGFGVTLRRDQSGTGSAANPAHSVFNQPDPAGTSFAGLWLSEGVVSGGDLSPILRDHNQQTILGEKRWGTGQVLFGGLSLPTFSSWKPQPEHNQLHHNIIHYAAHCANQPPIAQNVTIIPSTQKPNGLPAAGTEISVTYDFVDPDGDDEDQNQTQIRWKRIWKEQAQKQPGLKDKRMVPAGITFREEQWCVTVTPHDGTQLGQEKERCADIEVAANRLPRAENVEINQYPRVTESLMLDYEYRDPDNGPQEKADVLWYRDQQLQSYLNGTTIVSGDETLIGDEWCTVVRVHDEEEHGPPSDAKCTIIVGPDGPPPSISNVRIEPSEPKDSQDLQLLYERNDSRTLDPSQWQLEIRWFRDGFLQPQFNDQEQIANQFTSPGEKWWATIRPYLPGDQPNNSAKGRLELTAPVYILPEEEENTPPEVTDVQITPAEPNESDELRLTYEFVDNDQQGETIIRWYKDQTHMPEYDGLNVIPHGATLADEVWFAVVIPHDGSEYGPDVAAPSVVIRAGGTPGNTPPEARDVYLSPSQPDTDDNLRINYTYHDDDEDLENNTLIKWTRNGEAQARYNNRTFIPHQVTGVGKEWCAEVTPHDGSDYGEPVRSDCITILEERANTLPVVKNAHILPAIPASNQNLEVKYEYFDADGDAEDRTRIVWYKGKPEFDEPGFEDQDQTVIPAEFTSPDDVWQVMIQPHDGRDYGKPVWTRLVFINNPPEVISASIMPIAPTAHQPLTLEYDVFDQDRHPEGKPQIHWYKNGQNQPHLGDQTEVSPTETSPGERWYATIAAYDEYEYSKPLTTTEVIIQGGLYLPLLLRQPPPPPTPTVTPSGTAIPPTLTATPSATPSPTPSPTPVDRYEPNNTPESAYGPLISARPYEGFPDDVNDWYYFEIQHTTSSVQVEIRDYIESKDGQLVLYWQDPATQERDFVANDGGDGATRRIPNDGNPNILQDLRPGKYLIRVYTTDKHSDTESYRLQTEYE